MISYFQHKDRAKDLEILFESKIYSGEDLAEFLKDSTLTKEGEKLLRSLGLSNAMAGDLASRDIINKL